MKSHKAWLSSGFLVAIIGIANCQHFTASIIDVEYNDIRNVFYVNYNINNAFEDDLFLVEFRYVEFFEYNIIYPEQGSVQGDGGEYAIRGGTNKTFIWDFNRQRQTSLKLGKFEITVTLLSFEYSKNLISQYGRQNKIRVRLEEANLRSGQRRRLERRLDRVNNRIDRNKNRGY